MFSTLSYSIPNTFSESGYTAKSVTTTSSWEWKHLQMFKFKLEKQPSDQTFGGHIQNTFLYEKIVFS